MFVGTAKTVYIVDKVEANPTQVNGHPAWASGKGNILAIIRRDDRYLATLPTLM